MITCQEKSLIISEVFNLQFLAYPEGPVGRLVLDRRVPPAVEVYNMIGRRKVQAHSHRL